MSTARRAPCRRSLLASALILPASAAQAKGGPCLPDYPHGAHCHVWTGKVKQVDDGDTLDAERAAVTASAACCGCASSASRRWS